MRNLIAILFALIPLSAAALTSHYADPNLPSRPTIGVSLCGGGALGYAHMGMLQAMEEAGMKPSVVVGTSMGAIMGMMYCAGYSPQEILAIVKKERMDRILTIAKPSLRFDGLISTRPIQEVLLKYVPHNSFDSLNMPFYCCVADISALLPRYCHQGGYLVQSVMASAAIPGIFSPVPLFGGYCVDGSVFDQMPIKPLQQHSCDITVASLLRVEKPRTDLNTNFVWLHAISAACFHSVETTQPQFTYVIEMDFGKYWMLDFDKVDELYQIGYQTTKAYLAEVKSER